jgi:hypothetical protein
MTKYNNYFTYAAFDRSKLFIDQPSAATLIVIAYTAPLLIE